MNHYETTNTHSAPGALEISMRARARAKNLALMTAEFKATEKPGEPTKAQKRSRGLFTQLLTSLRIF